MYSWPQLLHRRDSTGPLFEPSQKDPKDRWVPITKPKLSSERRCTNSKLRSGYTSDSQLLTPRLVRHVGWTLTRFSHATRVGPRFTKSLEHGTNHDIVKNSRKLCSGNIKVRTRTSCQIVGTLACGSPSLVELTNMRF